MVNPNVTDIPLSEFKDAQNRIRGIAIKTPLVKLQVEGDREIYLKLENLQPVGSFKIRCAANALLKRIDLVKNGASTASAGNFAQGLAYAGRTLGIPINTYVPETAAQSKIEALKRLGSKVTPIPYKDWWAMLANPSSDPSFIHPATDPDVLAGNGTIALEILDELADTATVITPYGGGGLSVGIATALKAAGAKTKLIACETEAGAPLQAALTADKPTQVEFNTKTFITGMGGPTVLSSIWPLAKAHIAGTVQVSLAQTAEAIKLMAERHHIIAEGAGAAPVAAALSHAHLEGPIVCVVSGGHLDANHLITILQGNVP
ncbi:pyridoxal-phosphate dependent enzyme [Kordiimonas pumila]|uniref:Pyridoxal-phosphate dependent enzyme n=1 Tax=Kordiimonas pumila TaxID=2161677 RepID=A0ABV7D6K6_9PROT|nr:pyridoxal-phosphate dependent enzyme [Kordiimonas pumila]